MNNVTDRKVDTVTEDCGCETTTKTDTIGGTGLHKVVMVSHTYCSAHTEQLKEKQAIEKKIWHRRILNGLDPLDCNLCNQRFGWVYAGDLEGSEFVCNDCKIKN